MKQGEMSREALVSYINFFSGDIWEKFGMAMSVYEGRRGHWSVRLDNVLQVGVPTGAVGYVMRAMLTTALRHKPAEPLAMEGTDE